MRLMSVEGKQRKAGLGPGPTALHQLFNKGPTDDDSRQQ